jgi:hypothetical protein
MPSFSLLIAVLSSISRVSADTKLFDRIPSSMAESEEVLPPLPESLSASVWTPDDATAFLALSDDDTRLSFIQSLLSVDSSAYSNQIPSTFFVDFHLGNALFCQESGYSADQTAFVCNTLGMLLSQAIVPLSPPPDYDRLRIRLIRSLRGAFLGRRELFTYSQVQDICRHVASSLILPIRLIVFSFGHGPFLDPFLEIRKVWAPPPPPALEECDDDSFPEIPMRFTPAQATGALDAFWDRLMTVVDRRCITIEDKVRMLSEQLNSTEELDVVEEDL